jgi:dTDP-glucose 4,6-dehydratase
MPRTVISGGAGFIGSHLCDRFLADGHEVVCVDNLITGSIENLRHLRNHRGFEFVRKDIVKPFKIDGPVDFVLNFASPASPIDFTRIPLEILATGSEGTRHMLELARLKKARFMQASTSEVYGDPLVHPQQEEYLGNVNCIGIRGVYDEAKRFSEAITMAYRRQFNLETRIVRIFNTYGERMQLDDGRALPNFGTQALQNAPITVYGDGSQTRAFGYVSDLIEGVVRLLHSDYWAPINIGNPDEVSLLRVAHEVKALAGSQSEIVFRPLPPGDPKVRRPDITRAREILGWEPTISREEGFRRTIADFRTRMDREGETAA